MSEAKIEQTRRKQSRERRGEGKKDCETETVSDCNSQYELQLVSPNHLDVGGVSSMISIC
eukprot:124156-Hanusia_phi.AAC.3